MPRGLSDPQHNRQVEREYGRFIDRTIDPEVPLDLILGRPRILVFKQTPTRIYIPDESIARYEIITETEIAVIGIALGRTVLTIWVPDPDRPGQQRVLSYLLQVSEDAEFRIRQEAIYAALEREINENFCNSWVKLSLVGDKLVLRGEAKDVFEAAQILQVVNANAPRDRTVETIPVRDLNVFSGVTDLSQLPPGTLEDFLRSGSNPNVVNLLHIPGEQQVLLRVTVAEVNRDALRAMGVNMRVGPALGGTALQTIFPLATPVTAVGGNPLGVGGNLFVDRGDFDLAVNALRTLGMARTLAEPNLVTLNGKTATFRAGVNIAVTNLGGATGGAVLSGFDQVFAGITLSFTPYITDRDRIRLQLTADIGGQNVQMPNNQSGPNINQQLVNTVVELRDGQTLAVAGLLRNDLTAESRRVPFIGDLPVIGRLFKSDVTTYSDRELIMLVTPELVHPLEAYEVPPLPGADIFEPGDLEFFLIGRLESQRAYDYRSSIRTDAARMLRYRHCEHIYIIGPHGHADGQY
jgi:pilus assembly protein CpaC